ncbi:FAD-binding oxidoreductase [uncultured Tateyamaria sp.]|uniref:NAD(P)/FAD-dependent oxidoreductase n=1 Tax=uncultured Tateyamaria sp. TaxID=455651 RepID=UPI00262FC660|nr:FAD-dependent oxidoreductase [uncultured Tateyamaria sp.]
MTTGARPNRKGDLIHWQRTAGPAPVCDTLTTKIAADVVVVGGGLTGTRTALGLAESGARVVLLEGQKIGFGASGRSGGQCNPIWRATPDELGERLGKALATRLIETTLGSADALFDDINQYGITCDHAQNGWVQAAHCASAQRSLERLGTAWNAAGATIRFQDKDETVRSSGSPAYDFSLFHPKGGHVQPLSLTRGFAHAAIEHGATLYENSPVLSMKNTDGIWTVTTASGTVSAPQVILTTNAYSDDLWPKLRQTFFPLVSVSLATAPLSVEQQKTVLPGGVTIADTRRAIYYSRYDRDNRLIFGCVGSTDNSADFGGIARLKEGLGIVFPQLHGIGIEATWAGRIAVTPEMMPHLHEPAPGVLAGLGFSGRGIAMTSVMARTLIKKALGAADDTLPFAVTPVQSLPLHWASRKLIPLAAPAMTLRDKIDTMLNRS